MLQEIAKRVDLYLAFLSRLYTSNALTSSSIADVVRDLCPMCNRTKQIKKIFTIFKYLGINILPDILFHKLRFKCVTASIKVKKVRKCPKLVDIASSTPYVRSIALSYPKKVLISLYIPNNLDTNNISLDNYLDADIYVTNYVIRSKPLLNQLLSLLTGSRSVLSQESFSECLENTLNLPNDWERHPKISGIVLRILDILSTNPELSIEEVKDAISKALNKEVPIKRVKKYVNSASRFIYGYRVSIIKAPYVSDLKLLLFVKNLKDPIHMCLAATRHPLIISCTWNNDSAILSVSLPEISLASFTESIYWFVDQFGGEVVDEVKYCVNRDHMAVINIPYGEWSPLAKSWKEYRDSLRDSVDRLIKAGCVEV